MLNFFENLRWFSYMIYTDYLHPDLIRENIRRTGNINFNINVLPKLVAIICLIGFMVSSILYIRANVPPEEPQTTKDILKGFVFGCLIVSYVCACFFQNVENWSIFVSIIGFAFGLLLRFILNAKQEHEFMVLFFVCAVIGLGCVRVKINKNKT